MTSLHLSIAGLDALAKGFASAPELTRKELLTSMTSGTLLMQREIADRIPKVSGATSASVASDAFSTSIGVIGTVGSSQPSAVYLELGTKPHAVSRQGREALAEWAIKRLGVSAKEAPRVAFLVARKIARRGTKAQRPFFEGAAATEGQVLRTLEDAAGRVAAHLAGGAA